METVEARTHRIAALEQARALRQGGEPVESRALTRDTAGPLLLSTGTPGDAITPRNALGVADAYACVRALADAAATLPLHVFREASDGGRERAETPASRLLGRPAPAVTQAMLIAQLVTHLNLHGEAFIAKYRGESGEITQLGLLSPERVGVELKGGLPFYTVTTEDGRVGTYTTGDVIHVRGLTLDGLRGLSPVRQAREALGLAGALAAHGSAVFANGATPKGVLKVPPGPEAQDVMDNLRASWQDRHGGHGAGRVAVLQADVTFEAVSMSLADAEFLAQRELSTREVARIFRVPSWLINGASADSLTYSTVAESMRAFVLTGLKPWLVYVEQALGADPDLFPTGQRTYPTFVLDGLLRGDPKARADVYTAALNPQTGWMRRDEVRVLEDLPSEPFMHAPSPTPVTQETA